MNVRPCADSPPLAELVDLLQAWLERSSSTGSARIGSSRPMLKSPCSQEIDRGVE
jgi:hypothetical protein